VWGGPGQTVLTVTPNRASSRARDLEKALKPPRAGGTDSHSGVSDLGGTRAQRNDPAYLLHPRGSVRNASATRAPRSMNTSVTWLRYRRYATAIVTTLTQIDHAKSPGLQSLDVKALYRPREFRSTAIADGPPTRRPLLVPAEAPFVRLFGSEHMGVLANLPSVLRSRRRSACSFSESTAKISVSKLYVYHWPRA